MARIRDAGLYDVKLMGPNLRAGDVEEIHAATGKRAPYVLMQSYTVSAWAKVACDDQDHPVAMFGLVRVNENLGVPWMLVTEEFTNIAKPFRRQCRGVVDSMLDECAVLTNMVLATNTVAQRWLRWCGFHLAPAPIEHGPFNKLFYPFARYRNV